MFAAVKVIGGLAVGTGAGKIALHVIKGLAPVATSKTMSTCIKLGGVFLAGAAATAATTEFVRTIDTIEGITKTIRETITKLGTKEETEKAEA